MTVWRVYGYYGESSDVRIMVHHIRQLNIKGVLFLVQGFPNLQQISGKEQLFFSLYHGRYERRSISMTLVRMGEITTSVKPKTQLMVYFFLFCAGVCTEECLICHSIRACHTKNIAIVV